MRDQMRILDYIVTKVEDELQNGKFIVLYVHACNYMYMDIDTNICMPTI